MRCSIGVAMGCCGNFAEAACLKGLYVVWSIPTDENIIAHKPVLTAGQTIYNFTKNGKNQRSL